MNNLAKREQVQRELDGLTPEFLRSRSGVKWSRYPEPVLPAWVADMDYLVAPEIRDRLAEMVGRSDFGYTWVPAPPSLVEQFVERQKTRYGADFATENVVVTVTALQGVDVGIQLLSEPGDGVVVQTPIYPPFLSAVSSTGRKLVENPLRKVDGKFQLDLEGLDSVIDDRTRIVLLCNPHNPTGRSFSKGELEGLAERVLRHDLQVISDEIHADLTYSEHEHSSFAGLSPEIAERTLTITSATKAFNLAGLPCSFAAAGSASMRERFHSLPDHLLSHPGPLGIAAASTAWEDCDYWLEETTDYLDGNRRLLVDRLASEAPLLDCALPEATYLAWIDCNALPLTDKASRLFFKRGRLALHCGHDFGPPGSGCVRINFATSRSILDEMIDRIVAVTQEIQDA